MSTTQSITIRRARPDDAAELQRVAALDSQRVPTGDLWVAEVDGELVAAVTADGGCVADPFRHTADVVALLRLHARSEPRPRARRLGRALPAPSAG